MLKGCRRAGPALLACMGAGCTRELAIAACMICGWQANDSLIKTNSELPADRSYLPWPIHSAGLSLGSLFPREAILTIHAAWILT